LMRAIVPVFARHSGRVLLEVAKRPRSASTQTNAAPRPRLWRPPAAGEEVQARSCQIDISDRAPVPRGPHLHPL
jgi:hypothetical protein